MKVTIDNGWTGVCIIPKLLTVTTVVRTIRNIKVFLNLLSLGVVVSSFENMVLFLCSLPPFLLYDGGFLASHTTSAFGNRMLVIQSGYYLALSR